MARLETLSFDNRYARLPPPFWEKAAPTPIAGARLVSFNPDAAALIDLDPAEGARPELVGYFGGGEIPPGAEPVGMRYAGHQFGAFVPQLGDGRAILLGTVRNARGEPWDLHLKGSGPTAFSRGFDGRSVLRSAIREYLCSEALHHLGVPTTRALCLVVGDEPVRREEIESAATLVRLAPTHVRFGSFEYFYYAGRHEYLAPLADFVIENHFPELAGAPDRHVRLLGEAIERTARLMARWQAVGFAHGVMNTDNFSILGITLDFGPYGFMDAYDAGFVCNHTDQAGRYAFDQQPGIGQWNCAALAQAMLPLMTREDALAAIDRYAPAFEDEYSALMRAKLGLREARAGDAALLTDLLALMQRTSVDWTNTWRALGELSLDPARSGGPRLAFGDPAPFDAWAERYRARLAAEASVDAERRARMDAVNPAYVLRNWLAHEAIERAKAGDYSELERLLDVLRRPFAERPGLERYAEAPPDWGRHLVVSCSS